MTLRSIKINIPAIAAASLVVVGCATTKVSTTTWFPAQNPTLSKYRNVAAIPSQGGASEQSFQRFESLLASAKSPDGNAFFRLADRSRLQLALNELHLQNTGLINPKQASQIGKFVGAEAVYTLTTIIPPIARQTSTETRMSCPKGTKKCNEYNVTCTTKDASYEIVPRLVSVSTAQVLYQEPIVGRYSSKSCSDTGGEEADTSMRALQWKKHSASSNVSSPRMRILSRSS